MVPAGARPARIKKWGWGEGKGHQHPPASLTQEKVLSHQNSVSASPSHMTQVIFQLLPLWQDSERAQPAFPKLVGSPRHKPPWFSKPEVLGTPFPRAGLPGQGSDPSFSGKDLHHCDIPPTCESPQAQGRSSLALVSTPSAHLPVAFSLELQWQEICPASLQVNLQVVVVVVSLRGGEFRMSLLCSLALTARSLALEGQVSFSRKRHSLWWARYPHPKQSPDGIVEWLLHHLYCHRWSKCLLLTALL